MPRNPQPAQEAPETAEPAQEAPETAEPAQEAPERSQDWHRCCSNLEHPAGGAFFYVGQLVPPGTLTTASVAILLARAIIERADPPAAAASPDAANPQE